ncbi:MAG: hypothetical protein LC114_06770 [Bryobacterales bacterium]|nr:hypothetical protein [Bryobacterales bacterium]
MAKNNYREPICAAVSREVGVPIDNKEYEIGSWGRADCYAWLSKKKLLLLEIEKSQKHPCTNVLKLWPYLMERPDLRIVLVQAFFDTNPSRTGSRGALCTWLGSEMQQQLGGRFRYIRVLIASDDYALREGGEDLRTLLSSDEL